MLSAQVPDLAALQLLRLVQDHGSLSAAARVLGLSQQAVSERVRALERQVGATLLTRSSRGSELNATGTLIVGWAIPVLEAAEVLDAAIASLRQDSAARLRVVASQTVAEHLLPGWLVGLRRQHESLGLPPGAVELHVMNSRDACALVRSGEVELGFIESPSVPTGLRSRRLHADELAVVVPPGHPWTRRRRPLPIVELAQTALVTREPGSGTRESLAALLAVHASGVPVAEPAFEVATSAAVRSAIMAGIGPGVLSRLVVQDDLALGRLVAVPTVVPLGRPVTAIWQGGRTPVAGPARDLIAIAARG
jgi:molybdate transport repressor ModE-like protein